MSALLLWMLHIFCATQRLKTVQKALSEYFY
jgi:hypothetical protein